MAIVLKDRVKETTSTTGTSNFVLGGSSSGYQTFSVVGANNFTYYCCFDNATGDWEVGYGQYTTTAGGTLVRTTVLSNSAATTSKIAFAAGPKDVFITYPAEKAIYEEDSGNVLIDGGPITVIGTGVTGYTTFSAALGEMYADVNAFAQLYAQNLNDGASASADLVAYNDLGDGVNNFVDVGINSSNYTSVDYPIFTPSSAYLFNDGGELFVGSATDDLVLFAGGTDVNDEAVRIDKTSKAMTAVGAVNVGGALDITGAAVFGSTVLLDADPTLALQAATKAYVDTAVSTGLHVHQPVRLERGSNLNSTYNNGTAGVGATLTNAGTQAALVIDGVTTNTNDRILVYGQTNPAENGVYVVTTVGSGATNWVLTRASDADTYLPQSGMGLGGGDYFFVTSGDTGAGESYICTNVGTIVFGTTAITFTQFSASPTYTGTAPINVSGQVISLTGTVAATNGGTGVNTVTTGDLLYGSGTNTWSKLAAGAGYKSLVMNAGGTNVEWNAVALNQANAVSGSLGATNGGTGQNAYAVGDTLYSGTTNTLDKLAGNTTTTKKFLGQTGSGSASAAPVWQQPAATDITGLAASATTDTTNAANITSGTLPTARLSGSYTGITGVGTLAAGTWNGTAIGAIYGGTGQTSYAVGDLVYADTTTTITKLADVAVGNALISGGLNAAPSYGKIGLATHVSGTLPVANGGTGATDAAGIRTAAGATTVGGNVFTLTNPSAITFPRFNADNTVSALDAATFRTAIGAGTGAGTVTGVTGTAPVVSSGGATPAISMAAASSGVNGYMTGAYATKLDGIATGATNVTNTNQLTNGAGFITSAGTSAACSGNAATATNLSTTRTNWSTNGTITAVVGQLAWKNYANGHTIFDASASTSPDGGAVNNTNAAVAWFGTFPTLMGWNGSSTYGVRVDSARVADSAPANGGNSSTVGGFTPSQTNGTASRVVVADGSGYINNNYFNSTDNSVASGVTNVMVKQGDNYLRSGTAASIATFISGQSMNISGSSTSCSGNSANTSSISNAVGGGYTWTGLNYFRSNRDTSSNSAPLQAYSDNGSGAIMSFHRGGYYATNMGLDSDNVFRIGGWSAPVNRFQMDMSGNLTMAGNVTAYSDERLKRDWTALPSDFVESLAAVKSGAYTRIDSNERQAGSSAQDWQKLLPEVVSTDNKGHLGLAYGNAALVSAVELAKRVVEQDKRIAKLEALVAKLTEGI